MTWRKKLYDALSVRRYDASVPDEPTPIGPDIDMILRRVLPEHVA